MFLRDGRWVVDEKHITKRKHKKNRDTMAEDKDANPFRPRMSIGRTPVHVNTLPPTAQAVVNPHVTFNIENNQVHNITEETSVTTPTPPPNQLNQLLTQQRAAEQFFAGQSASTLNNQNSNLPTCSNSNPTSTATMSTLTATMSTNPWGNASTGDVGAGGPRSALTVVNELLMHDNQDDHLLGDDLLGLEDISEEEVSSEVNSENSSLVQTNVLSKDEFKKMPTPNMPLMTSNMQPPLNMPPMPSMTYNIQQPYMSSNSQAQTLKTTSGNPNTKLKAGTI